MKRRYPVAGILLLIISILACNFPIESNQLFNMLNHKIECEYLIGGVFKWWTDDADNYFFDCKTEEQLAQEETDRLTATSPAEECGSTELLDVTVGEATITQENGDYSCEFDVTVNNRSSEFEVRPVIFIRDKLGDRDEENWILYSTLRSQESDIHSFFFRVEDRIESAYLGLFVAGVSPDNSCTWVTESDSRLLGLAQPIIVPCPKPAAFTIEDCSCEGIDLPLQVDGSSASSNPVGFTSAEGLRVESAENLTCSWIQDYTVPDRISGQMHVFLSLYKFPTEADVNTLYSEYLDGLVDLPYYCSEDQFCTVAIEEFGDERTQYLEKNTYQHGSGEMRPSSHYGYLIRTFTNEKGEFFILSMTASHPELELGATWVETMSASIETCVTNIVGV